MSTLKLQKDIELLENKLSEIEANISDPIERIEQKKQLQKEIKKLERSKSQIERLEQEQQELEFLKSEFSQNNNESVTQTDSKIDEQAEFTPETNTAITNKFMAVGSEINLSKQIEDNRNSQVSNTNHKEDNSDTITPNVLTSLSNNANLSNNSKKLGKAWIIGGTIGFFIFLGLIINGNRVNLTESNIEQQTSDTISTETLKQDNSSETEIIESSPEVSTQLQEENFDNYDFPLDSCGDKDSSGANIWYRVYIDDTPENLNTIHSNYCRDAIRKYRQNEQINSIQVAAFTNESKAEAFAQLMRINIGSGEVSELSTHNLYTESITTTSPREFVINHYSELNNRNYSSTWQHLTPEFQAKSKSLYGYTDWWNSVENIEIGEIQVLEQNNNRAVLNVSLTYLMKAGSTYKDPKSRIELIWDNSANSWLFENKQ